MAKYFEAVNPGDESIVIDDTLMCLELRGTYPLSIFNRFPGDAYRVAEYSLRHDLGDGIFWGIGLDGLTGKSFCPEIIASSLYVSIQFRNPAEKNFHKDKILRDDIAATANLHAFSLAPRAPTDHGLGMEIYNDQGKVVYSSAYGHLHVLGCDCVDFATVSYGGTGVVFALGRDIAYDYYISRKQGIFGAEYAIYPQITVGSNSVAVKKIIKQTMYVDSNIDAIKDDPDHEHHYASGHAYGWLVGEII